ncbi:hypothetical protein BDZ97DRAFT_1828506 [Flammula alnicola]|nr:hypothetical protein BDZ97DRAFT_1843811 [Flammula alnicola]KAF8961493.1 hypothetical protein BDZ97DRAFT_1828506 [Flammula alnicola]
MDVDQPIGSTTSSKIPLPARKGWQVSKSLDGPTTGQAQELTRELREGVTGVFPSAVYPNF